MTSNTSAGANAIAVVNTTASGSRVLVVTSPTTNSWTLRAITVENLLANSTHDVKAANLIISYSTTPANSTANCLAGQFWFDSNYMYLATANNTIKRVALETF